MRFDSQSRKRFRRQNPLFRILSSLLYKLKSLKSFKISSFKPKFKPRVSAVKPSEGRKKYKRKYKFIYTFFGLLFKQYKIFFAVILLGGTIIFLRLIFSTNYFEIKEFRFEGVEQIQRAELEQVASKYKGKNIYTINLDDVEKDVQGLSVYIKGVYARKQLPSKIIVEITERYPNAVLVNFDGVYLIDKDNYVVAIPFAQTIKFSDQEWQAYYSQDVNLKIVQERVKANLQKEGDNEDFDYSKIDNEIKQNALHEIKQEMSQVINAHFDTMNKQINKSEYAGFQRIYFYDNAKYKEGDIIDDKALIYTTKVLDFFNRQNELTVSKTIWESRFSLTVETLEGKIFVFGINREIEDQLGDLGVILKELKAEHKDYKKIDLRSEIIGVK